MITDNSASTFSVDEIRYKEDSIELGDASKAAAEFGKWYQNED